ncbi:MAG: hypothetical protein FWD01_04365 [Defluviitaleaceae bacterium]|nr:hypothetical protein [Defluviitaleaceae bacterium]
MALIFDITKIKPGNGVHISFANSQAQTITGTVSTISGSVLSVQYRLRGLRHIAVISADEISSGIVEFRWAMIPGTRQQYPNDSLLIDDGSGSGGSSGGGITQQQLQDALTTKLDKVTTGDKAQIYAVDSANEQNMLTVVANSAAPNSIPERNANGNFVIGSPTADGEAANKGYVDQSLDTLFVQRCQIPLNRTIGGSTSVPRASLDYPDALFAYRKSLITDAFGTLAVYIDEDVNTGTINVMTKTISPSFAQDASGQDIVDYNSLANIPQINNIALIGNLSPEALGLVGASAMTALQALIPSQANISNQLADKNFVNSTVQTLSANKVSFDEYGNPFPTRTDLTNASEFFFQGVLYEPKQGDYCTVLSDETHNQSQARYVFDGVGWSFQFLVNDTPFTAVQNAAINSGITSELVGKLSENINPLISYSAVEQEIPGVKWLDGKQVYQITVQGSTGATQNAFINISTIPNFGSLVDIRGFMINSTGSALPSGFYNPQSSTAFALSVNASGDVQSFHSGAAFNNMALVATVQYTKAE